MPKSGRSLPDLKTLKTRPTLKPMEAFALLGCGRTKGYEMVRRGEFPVPVLRIGRNIRIPTEPLLELLRRRTIPAA